MAYRRKFHRRCLVRRLRLPKDAPYSDFHPLRVEATLCVCPALLSSETHPQGPNLSLRKWIRWYAAVEFYHSLPPMNMRTLLTSNRNVIPIPYLSGTARGSCVKRSRRKPIFLVCLSRMTEFLGKVLISPISCRDFGNILHRAA